MSEMKDIFPLGGTQPVHVLKRARISVGYSIDAISVGTGIPAQRLWAIEQGSPPTERELDLLRTIFANALF
ncbi:helix-turn-helix domain-containing protein [Jiella pacifica]|uniref:XRE family transcriptional regulator n=1 Tax=Jiella pacifica TaxID=2696469 RepID=A0A6N9T7C1_9HYPH|nr:helix-turn-helix domain-containing protein [Jiella pacifica]NDW07307.1 hypothetical protein [Jiella pacifica]